VAHAAFARGRAWRANQLAPFVDRVDARGIAEDGDVVERIAVDDEQVCLHTRRERADFALPAESRRIA
jgi:hypothetical protein